MTLIFETGQKKREEIPLALVPLVMICTWITHLFGGSAGREGVAVQIGATISHEAGRRLHIKEKTPVMLITGMAAGFGGLFQTPLAAVFFAMEVIVAGYMEYDALLPALIAAYTASTTSHMLGLEKFAVNITENWNISWQQRCFNLDYSWSSFRSYRKILFCSFTESQEIVRRKDFQSLYPNRYPGSSACNPSFCNPQRTLYRTGNQSDFRFICRRNDLRI